MAEGAPVGGGGGGRGGSRGRGRGRGGGGASGAGRGRGAGRGTGRGNDGVGGGGRGSEAPGQGDATKKSGGKEAPSGRAASGVGGNKNRGKNGNSKSSSSSSNNKTKQHNEPKLSLEERKKQEDERLLAEAAEAERRRQEAELKALEAARAVRAKEREQLNARVKEANDYLQSLAESVALHKENRAALCPESLVASRNAFETNKKLLKSDLKKCTAFVKKIKGGTAWSMKPDDIVKDIKTLNLSRYVEEVVAAILEAKLKVTDLPVVVALSRAMHERYPAFLENLVPGLWAVVTGKAADETGKNKRIYVRLITEFLLNGIYTDTKPLIKLITDVTGAKEGNYIVTDANIVVAFVKTAGFEILGIPPESLKRYMNIVQEETAKWEAYQKEMLDKSDEEKRQMDIVVVSTKLIADGKKYCTDVSELLSERAVSSELGKELLTHCRGAYKFLSISLVATHGKLQKMEKRCEQDRLLSGSLTDAREKGLVDARKLKESLLRTVEALSDVLDLPMPRLKVEENEEAETGAGGLELWTKGGGEDGADFGPFDDEETKAFYCDVPDFLVTVPPALLGISQDEIEKRKAVNLLRFGSGFEDIHDEGESDTSEVVVSSEEQLLAAEEGEAQETSQSAAETTDENKDTPHYKLMVLLEQEMPECSRREDIDELAEKFCTNHGSSKNARKRLIRTLFHVPRTRLDLLPYYARLTTSLSKVWGDIAEGLVTDLEQQFHGQAKFKKNQNIESRLRTARYIGELTKFRLAPPMVAFRCIRRCLDDLTGGNVDVACCVLESCGRFLYRLKHTNQRVTALMEALARLGKAKHLDERSQSLIKSAFYSVRPPAGGPKKKPKSYPPVEGYLRDLLMVKLQPSESSIAFVSKQLIRCPWNDKSQQCGALICRIMLKACRRGRYKSIQAVASLAAKLRRHKPEVCIRLLDAVLEELQLAMEFPSFKDQQRTLTMARLLGELYGASLASAQLILQQLYNFINFGHDIPLALRDASERLIDQLHADDVPNSAGGVSHTIDEDEEVDEADLQVGDVLPRVSVPVAVSKYSEYDPRVPTVLDPPNSVFRVKLAYTLMEAVVKTIVTRSNLPKIESFLTAFQRYLFTKTVLPAEVEFALLDIFDAIDSQWRKISNDTKSRKKGADNTAQGFPRYRTWLEAHNATVAVEESEALSEERSRRRLDHLAFDHLSADGDETIASDLLDEDDDMMEEDDEASMDDALSMSVDDDHDSYEQFSGDEVGEEEAAAVAGDFEDLDEDKDDESEEDEDEEDEFDEDAYMQQLEAEAFERELRRLTMEALEKGKGLSRGGKVADSMPTGSQVIKKKIDTEGNTGVALGGKTGVSFQLLKKGNKGKMEAKQFFVPSDTNLAAVASKQDDKAAKERYMIKARVLQYEAESAEAELSGGNVYLEQEKLQVIRNRLSMEEIDRNFGTTGGNLRPTDKTKSGPVGGRGPGRGPSIGGRILGRGRSGGRNGGGRSLV